MKKQQCLTCKKFKTKENYYKSTNSYQSHCIACTKKRHKKINKKKTEALKLYRSFYK